MNTAKLAAATVAGLLLFPLIAIVATVGLINAIVGNGLAACQLHAGTPPAAGAAGPAGAGAWIATAYGPPWGGIEGGGVTATGLDLTPGQAAYEIAVDPAVIALRSFAHVTPNPFGTSAAFYAGDTGGAILGRHVDIYDWRGRGSQNAWGVRHVTITPAPTPGAGNLLGQITPPVATPPVATPPVATPPGAAAPAVAAGCAARAPLQVISGPTARILPGGLAAAPARAPAAVKRAIAAGNDLIDRPYLWGGGHGLPLAELTAGYDCSSSSSYVLHGAGVLGGDYALDSTGLESYGQPGPGRWITVYANSAHAFIVVAGIVLDTAWYAPVQPTTPGSGPRWQPASIIAAQYAGDTNAGHGGFVQRHPGGL